MFLVSCQRELTVNIFQFGVFLMIQTVINKIRLVFPGFKALSDHINTGINGGTAGRLPTTSIPE